jgi:hypothetical protein
MQIMAIKLHGAASESQYNLWELTTQQLIGNWHPHVCVECCVASIWNIGCSSFW